MPIQTINIGTYSNDGTGDDLRTAFEKVNANFTLLGSTVGITDGVNLGTGTAVFAQRNNTTANLEFKTITSTDGSVELTSTANTVNLKGLSKLENDPNPTLSNNLNLNGNYIYGGNILASVFSLDIRVLNALIVLMLTSNSVTIDFGSFIPGTPGTLDAPDVTLDMNGLLNNGFAGNPEVPTLDFGGIYVT